MLEDVAGSRTFSTASPDSVTSVTCAQCEPAFICEEHRAPVVNLPILVFSGKCQTSCTVLGCKHNPHLWTSGPHTTLMESVSDRLSRHMHICEQCIYICPLSPIGILEVRTVSEGGVLAIKGVKSQYYISMNRTGLLQGKKIYNENCNFKEIFLENYFNAYSSVKSSRDDKEMFIALSQKGRPLRGKKTRREHIASHFIPMKCREEERTGL
uniref:Fibroblast growth factor n=1 Tax=Oncorhynchus kisutch TaxID=8019 RepID=A0A8C7F7E3_ONCKI